jgi:acetoin utilization protein AcuB
MLVGRHMTQTPVTVTPDEKLDSARKKMQDGNFRRLPVVADGQLVGIVTDRDLRQHMGHLKETKVNAAMTEEPLTVTPQTTLEETAKQLLEHKIGGLPVMEGKRLKGVITTSDILQAFLDVMGASIAGTARLDLLIRGDEHQNFAAASQIIEAAEGDILGVGTHREQWNDGPVFYIRVRAKDPAAIGRALEKEGYTVLGVQT